jgi:hypothetical protein
MTEYIHANSKYGSFEVCADDGTLASAALKLLTARVDDGYWYDDVDEQDAMYIVACGDGKAAWKFLNDRRDYEYEWVEARSM